MTRSTGRRRERHGQPAAGGGHSIHRQHGRHGPLSIAQSGAALPIAGGIAVHVEAPTSPITTRNGQRFNVNLSGAETVGDVIDAINAATGGSVTARLATVGNGIELVDNTAGAGQLTVTQDGRSQAAEYLGLIPTDDAGRQHTGTLIGADQNFLESASVFTTLLRLRDALPPATSTPWSGPSRRSTPTSTARPSPAPRSAPASRRSTIAKQNLEDEDVQLAVGAVRRDRGRPGRSDLESHGPAGLAAGLAADDGRTSCSSRCWISSEPAHRAQLGHASHSVDPRPQKLRSFSGFARCRRRWNQCRQLVQAHGARSREHRSACDGAALARRRHAAPRRESDDMEVTTSRFGTLQAPPSDILLFEQGLIGLRTLPSLGRAGRRAESRAGLAAVPRRSRRRRWASSSPRRFVPDYQLRVARQELAPLGWPARATPRWWSSSAGIPRGCR